MFQIGFSELVVIGLSFLFLADKQTFPEAIKKARELYSKFMKIKGQTIETVEMVKSSITDSFVCNDDVHAAVDKKTTTEREVYVVGNDGKQYKAYVMDSSIIENRKPFTQIDEIKENNDIFDDRKDFNS